MRTFSKELVQDRDFEIGGQVFTWRYPFWEETAEMFDAKDTEQQDGEFSLKVDTQFAIERMPIFLEEANDAHNRWKELMERRKDAVPRYQIVQLYRWLVEQTSTFPTPPPSDLETGAGSNGTSSEVASLSLEETPVA